MLKSKSGIEPRLLAVRGPLKGHMIELPQGEYWVGRQSTNDLQLEDTAVSRRHCLFIRAGDGCTLKDLESRNGTFVTGTPVTEQELKPGDEIRIGGSVFCYMVDPGAGLSPEKNPSVSSTREIRLEDSLYLSSDEYTILPPSARALHDLRTLLRVSTMLHSFRGLHDTTSATAAEILRSHLTSLLLDLIPASHAAIFIPGSQSDIGASTLPVLERTVEERVVIWQEGAENNGLSILAAPLIVRERGGGGSVRRIAGRRASLRRRTSSTAHRRRRYGRRGLGECHHSRLVAGGKRAPAVGAEDRTRHGGNKRQAARSASVRSRKWRRPIPTCSFWARAEPARS